MASKQLLTLAAAISADMLRGYERYLEECDEWQRKGYRPHYCEHGTNRWTDYDNICGGCEEGYSMRDGVFRRREALAEAKAQLASPIALNTLVRYIGSMVNEHGFYVVVDFGLDGRYKIADEEYPEFVLANVRRESLYAVSN
jgi:hypothetical protein